MFTAHETITKSANRVALAKCKRSAGVYPGTVGSHQTWFHRLTKKAIWCFQESESAVILTAFNLATLKGHSMATVTIENARVERIISGYGFKASESTLVKGEEKKTWFTVWTKETVTEGQIVTLEGDLSVKLEEFTGRDGSPKQTAAIHVNNALLMTQDTEAPF